MLRNLKNPIIGFLELSGVDFRAKNLEAFDAMERNSVDLYATVRSLYLQDREKK